MIVRRGVGLNIILSLIILIAFIHGSAHIVLFRTNISLSNTLGLSGFVIGTTDAETIELNIRQDQRMLLPSMIIILGEWVLAFSLLTLAVIRGRLTKSVEKAAHIELLKKKNKNDTDIDILYEMLKKNKRIPLSRIAELFKVDKKVVEEWGKILEENGYAVVDYPRFGEIEIILKEDEEAPKA